MNAVSGGLEKVCPECGAVVLAAATQCSACGSQFGAVAAPVQQHRERAAARLPLTEHLGPVIKIVVLLGILGLIGWGVYYAATSLWRDTVEATPYPRHANEAATQFFTGLYEEDYQSCYGLLPPTRKAATVIGQQSRGEGYFPHFARIRRYLVKNAGEEFDLDMVVSDDGKTVTFANRIVLTLRFARQKGLEDEDRYALREVNEFPIDAAPGLGLAQHNRGLGRAIESMGATTGGEEDADITEIIARKDYENRSERRERLIDSFRHVRQLDTKQELLEWLAKEFGQDEKVRRLFVEVADSQDEPPQLAELARRMLDYWDQS